MESPIYSAQQINGAPLRSGLRQIASQLHHLSDVGGNCRAQRKEFDMPAEEAKLLPCPFCGSEAHIHYTPDDVAWWVTCDKCEADGPWGNDCVDKWNRRADIKEVRSTTSTNSAIMPLLKAATA